MKKLLLIYAVLCLASCASVKQYNEKISASHSVEELHGDIDLAYHKLQKLHPKLYQYISKKQLDFKFDSLKKSIQKPIKSHVFYEKLATVVSEIKQGHISVSPPYRRLSKKERKQNKKKKFEFYDLDFEYLDNAVWVKNTRGKDSTIIGSQVIKVGEESVAKLFKKYKPLFASDGYNTTLHNRFMSSRFSRFYYKDKGRLDSLSVTYKKQDSIFSKVYKRVEKKLATNKKEDTLTHEKPKKLTKIERKEARTKRKAKRKHNDKYGYDESRKNYTRNFNFIGKDSSVAYLKIRGFGYGNYKDFYEETFSKIDSAKAKVLVLDLRDNPGGSLNQIDKLYSYLTDKEYQFINEGEVLTRLPLLKTVMASSIPTVFKFLGGLFSPFIVTHNLLKTHKKDGKLYYKFRSSKTHESNPLNFKGDIYVLINGMSFSASSILSTNLKATKRAIFIGEETGGAYNGTVAGMYKFVELPNSKVKITMGLIQIETSHKISPDGFGIKPDIEIIPTQKDRETQIDPELQWVLDTVESKD